MNHKTDRKIKVTKLLDKRDTVRRRFDEASENHKQTNY